MLSPLMSALPRRHPMTSPSPRYPGLRRCRGRRARLAAFTGISDILPAPRQWSAAVIITPAGSRADPECRQIPVLPQCSRNWLPVRKYSLCCRPSDANLIGARRACQGFRARSKAAKPISGTSLLPGLAADDFALGNDLHTDGYDANGLPSV